MRRRADCLVEKRDGRREWLRASKLARSIHLALQAAGAPEPWRALEVAEAVLVGLRHRRAEGLSLPTAMLADGVSRVLLAIGYPVAALQYERVGAELRRRRAALQAQLPAAAAHPGRFGLGCGDLNATPRSAGRGTEGHG